MVVEPDHHFPNPAELLVVPDHYILRMLYSQGVLEEGHQSFSCMPREAFDAVMALKLTGTLLSPQVLGAELEKRPAPSMCRAPPLPAASANRMRWSASRSGWRVTPHGS